MELLHDYETRSEIALPKTGVWRYAADPSTEPLCASYAWREHDTWSPTCLYVRVWGDNEFALRDKLAELGIIVSDRKHFVDVMNAASLRIAHNMEFERAITACHFPEINAPLEQWSCTMARAHRRGLPGGLDALMHAIGGPPKDAAGHRAMLTVCRPRTAWVKDNSKAKWFEDADRLAKVYVYATNDAASEKFAHDNLPELEDIERERWLQIVKENTDGLRIDVELLASADAVVSEYIGRVKADVVAFTCNGITNLGSGPQVHAFLRTWGVDMVDLTAETVEATLQRQLPDAARFVLEAKQKIAKASVAKIKKFYDRIMADGCVHDFQAYHGAHTGRTTGRGVQPLNFPRPGDVELDGARIALRARDTWSLEQCVTKEARNRQPSTKAGVTSIKQPRNSITVAEGASSCLRTFVVPREGNKYILADYSGVEMVATMTVAGQNDALELIRAEKDMYCELAEEIYGYPVFKKEHPEERQLGKQGVLGCFGSSTPVLTRKHGRVAWTAISFVDIQHEVWDGNAWVRHSGMIPQGKKLVISMENIHVTPDHLIALPGRWLAASLLVADQTLRLEAVKLAQTMLPDQVDFTTYSVAKGPAMADVYDISFAGPLNRYTIRTNVGPMLVHNCGFGLKRPETFMDTCRKYGMVLTEAMAQQVIDAYAIKFSKVPQLWDGLGDGAMQAMKHPNKIYEYANIRFEFDGSYWLSMQVPSGSKLWYPGAHLAENRWGRRGVHYATQKLNQWVNTGTYGGKLTENAIQKLARCMLEEHKAELLGRGLIVAFTIYDEIVFDVPEAQIDWALGHINEVMNQPTAWLPNMPVSVEPMVSDFFTKD